MSTIYSINAESSTTVSASDQFPMYKTSTGRTMKAAASAIQTYVLGSLSTSTVGFYGATPVVRPSGAGQADILSTAAVSSIATTAWGYATSTQANGVITLIRAIRTALVTDLGLLSGS
jgi:hypothetical protein